MRYQKFGIVETAKLCGIRLRYGVTANRTEVEAQCPFCGDTKFHLYLNRETDMFYCHRCKAKGNSVTLYACIFGISNREAFRNLQNKIAITAQGMDFCPKRSNEPLKGLEERHNVYYDFLKLLRLQPYHYENLEKRGLNFSEINRFMYRSIPLDRVYRRMVLERLSVLHDLTAVPGFFKDANGDWQMYIHPYGGILIPVCDKNGYIQGLQIRLDLPKSSEEKKFRWFSSRNFSEGAGATGWIHVVGDTDSRTAYVSEGAMKCDIASVLSGGKLFLAVPGVNAIEHLPQTIRSLGVTTVYEAWDMDKRRNVHVADALHKFYEMLRMLGVQCKSLSWDPYYNGIDELYAARYRTMVQSAAA